MITTREINMLTESETKILLHLENYSEERRFKIYAADFILRCQLKTNRRKKSGKCYTYTMSNKTFSKCLGKLSRLGFIDKETIVMKPQYINGKWTKCKSVTYITTCKRLYVLPITSRPTLKGFSNRPEGNRYEVIGRRPEKTGWEVIGGGSTTSLGRFTSDNIKAYTIGEYAV